jgi:hypothetical protein
MLISPLCVAIFWITVTSRIWMQRSNRCGCDLKELCTGWHGLQAAYPARKAVFARRHPQCGGLIADYSSALTLSSM